MSQGSDPAEIAASRRLFIASAGFLKPRLCRVLRLAGYQLRLGRPGPEDFVAVWGQAGTAHRSHALANATGARLLHIEDAFLRSLFPGRSGSQTTGLLIDPEGLHFDPAQPSALETLLSTHPLDDTALLDRARGAIARIAEDHLTKYSATNPGLAPPEPGYVLVIDQTLNDAAVTASGADRARFQEMLVFAQEEHPGAPVIIKTHPETTTHGGRAGYYTEADANARVSLLSDPISPQALFEGAVGVYTVSSQLGFEAIFAGHRPRVFGQPFYAGWGLTADEFPVPRRQRRLTRAQLFAAAMILYPTWYDPARDRICQLEDALEGLAAETRAWREDQHGWVASGMRLWKRGHLQRFYGSHAPLTFEDDPAKARAKKRPWMVWAGKAEVGHADATRVEDGFLRSRGLGAALTPPLSLVADDLGMYYDASRPSRLEKLIAARATLRPDQQARAERLIETLCAKDLTKYNLSGDLLSLSGLTNGPRILVPGQVADDASIKLGTDTVNTNATLLAVARAANPEAIILYKPHPDVEAGLRDGALEEAEDADMVARNASASAILGEVDAVWTMTSLIGFEALIRGLPVTTLGTPFYAGWGLTTDLGDIPPRRRAEPSLAGLVHAALIDYPRYRDPVSGLPCPVETIVHRLATGEIPAPSWGNRTLSKLQGLFASQAHLWRR